MASLLKIPTRSSPVPKCLILFNENRFYSNIPPGGRPKSTEAITPAEDSERSKREGSAECTDEEDWVGPVCSRSNLRPVRYSARFSNPTPVNRGARQQKLQHPYSLQEFRADPVQLPPPLAELRERLELEDLQWRFFRTRVDKFNQSFWESQSTRFEEREAGEKHKVMSSSKQDLSTVAEKNSVQERLDHSLDDFYRSWLVQEKSNFMKYNWQWWKFQPALMKGGWKAQMRDIKWKLACWKYSLSFKTFTNQHPQ